MQPMPIIYLCVADLKYNDSYHDLSFPITHADRAEQHPLPLAVLGLPWLMETKALYPLRKQRA